MLCCGQDAVIVFIARTQAAYRCEICGGRYEARLQIRQKKRNRNAGFIRSTRPRQGQDILADQEGQGCDKDSDALAKVD